MIFKCLLVDDEPYALELLAHHIQRFDDFMIVATCRDTDDALQVLNREKIDLMFLDIRMPGKDGIRFLSGLEYPPKVILSTAYREYALDGYELGVVDYLLKPISFVRFTKAIEKFRAGFNPPVRDNILQAGQSAAVIIKSGYEQYKIYPDDITFLESRREYIRIAFQNTAPVMVRATMQQILGYLPPGKFVQVHKSYIVPVKTITHLSTQYVHLGLLKIPLGRTYKKMVEAAMLGLPEGF
jgi:two-component system LytT family response regulator